jgi:bis(5'-nucleosyl)-tetraphosphatase (symmetrical)
MATWVIGDIHGCWQTLQALLERIEWRPGRDDLWLVGDLVNRGPASLEVLRWAYEHRGCVVSVLGNHDLHLLARAAGAAKKKKDDVLDEVLDAPDRDLLLEWVRSWPMVHNFGPFVVVHAGFCPQWNIEFTRRLAMEVSDRLAGAGGDALLAVLSDRRKKAWSPELEGDEALASAAAAFTRIRMVDADGAARLSYSGAPGSAPAGWSPWFRESAVRRQGYTVIFGHWAMFGFYRSHDVACLDSGCVYGGRLTAMRLDDGAVVQERLADPVEIEGEIGKVG